MKNMVRCTYCDSDVSDNEIMTEERIVRNPLYGGDMKTNERIGCIYCLCDKCFKSGHRVLEELYDMRICPECIHN